MKYKIGAAICIAIAVGLFVWTVTKMPQKKEDSSPSKQLDGVSMQYCRPDFDMAWNYIDNLEHSIDVLDDVAYKRQYDGLNELLTEISTQNRILMIERYNDINSVELIEEYDWFFAEYEKLYAKYAEYFSVLFASDRYAAVSKDWSDEDRKQESEVLEALNPEYKAYINEQNEILQKYYLERAQGYVFRSGEKIPLSSLTEDENLSEEEHAALEKEALQNYYTTLKMLYLDEIANNNNYAGSSGYADYAEFFYTQNDYGENFHDTEFIYDWVKQELVPLYHSVYEELDLMETSNVLTGTYSLEETISKVKSGLEALNPQIRKSFDNMFENKRIDIGNQPGKSTNNFTTYLYSYGFPYVSVYLNENYLDRGSILHEFGHYYGYENAGVGVENYMDVFESMAQAMNCMYWAEQYRENGFTTEIRLNILNILQTTILSTMIDEFETYAYTEHVGECQLLDRKYYELLEEYGLSGAYEDYAGMGDWAYFSLILENPFYYRYYMMSSIPALMILAEGMTSTEKAVTLYQNMIGNANTTVWDVMKSFPDAPATPEETLWKITKMLKPTLQK